MPPRRNPATHFWWVTSPKEYTSEIEERAGYVTATIYDKRRNNQITKITAPTHYVQPSWALFPINVMPYLAYWLAMQQGKVPEPPIREGIVRPLMVTNTVLDIVLPVIYEYAHHVNANAALDYADELSNALATHSHDAVGDMVEELIGLINDTAPPDLHFGVLDNKGTIGWKRSWLKKGRTVYGEGWIEKMGAKQPKLSPPRKKWVLVNKHGIVKKIGQIVKSSIDDGKAKIIGLQPPHKEGSSGRVEVKWIKDGWTHAYYPSVFDLKFIEVE